MVLVRNYKFHGEISKMNNSFIKNLKDEKCFYSLIENLINCKVGFYSVGLYPASLAYNCAMHG